jgi:hypothetical protein
MKLWGFIFLCLSANAVLAQESSYRPTKSDYVYQHKLQFVIDFGLQNGGDRVGTLYEVNSGETLDTLRAGGFWQAQIGAQIPIANLPFSVQVTGGLQYGDLISNIDHSKGQFQRKLLEGIVFWHWDRFRFGAGATQHIAPTLTFNPSGAGNSARYEFDDATGLVAEADARYDQNISVGLRGTVIQYEIAGEAISGNSIGLHLTYAF